MSDDTPAAVSGEPRAIEQLLPADGALVDRMDGEAPAELIEAVRKFKEAAQSDPKWFQAAVEAAGPGVQMPYDPRMGVTREEYELIVHGTELIKMKKGASVPLQARRSGNLVEIDGGEALPELTGVVFDLASKTVTTPYGTAEYDGEVQASDGQKMTGPWNGHGWQLEKGNAQSGGTFLRIYLGQLTESGRGLLVYDLRHLDAAGPKRLSLYLNYDLP